MAGDSRYIFKEAQRFLDVHIQHVKNTLPFILHLERFPVVPLPLADFAGNIDVWQKIHLNLYDTVSGAGFTPSALYVKAEPSLAESPHLRFLSLSEEVPDMCKHTGISVSYTHLDVYKRQPVYGARYCRGAGSLAGEFTTMVYSCLLYTSRCV